LADSALQNDHLSDSELVDFNVADHFMHALKLPLLFRRIGSDSAAATSARAKNQV